MPPSERYIDDRDDDLPPPPSGGSGSAVVWIVLAVVGGVVVLIASPFLLCCLFGFIGGVARGPVAPMPGPIAATAVDEDVTEFQDKVEVGDLFVKVASAKVGRVAILDADGRNSLAPGELLQVTVEVENTNANKPANFKPWYNSSATTCQDDVGIFYNKATIGLPPGAKVVGRQEQPAKIKSDKPLTDVLVFERPALNIHHVIVTLPASSVGGTGVLKFRINVEDFQK